MDTDMITKIVIDEFGLEPMMLERMTVGRINVVYNVLLPDREVIIRLNENPFVLKGTSHNIAVLDQMGLPVPKMLMEDLTKTRYPFHYQILDKIAGRDLGLELHNMTKDQMTRLAKTIVSYQQQVAKLPLGSGYGWVAIGDKGEFRSWTDLIQRDFQIGLPNVKKHLSPTQTDCIVQELDRIIPYLASIQPVCFLDDVTTKNVLVLNGELQGIVDLDCVCYGDPLYMIALTQTAICADMHVPDLYYIDALCRAWGLTNNQRKIVDIIR